MVPARMAHAAALDVVKTAGSATEEVAAWHHQEARLQSRLPSHGASQLLCGLCARHAQDSALAATAHGESAELLHLPLLCTALVEVGIAELKYVRLEFHGKAPRLVAQTQASCATQPPLASQKRHA